MKKISELVTCPDCKAITPCRDTEVIRADAINDIKELQKRIDILANHKGNCMSNNCIQCDNIIDMQSVIRYLKFKYQIKEEEIKC